MDWHLLLQELLAHGIYALLIVAGGFLLGLLKARNSNLSGPVLYAVVTIACLSVIWFSITGRGIFSSQQPETTPENVEANIKAWADEFQLGVTKMPSIPDANFGLVITLRTGTLVQVVSAKARPAYLNIQSTIALAPEHQAMLAKLPKEQAELFIQELTLELARSRMGFVVTKTQGGNLPMEAVLLSKAVPLSSLNDGTFASYMDEMDIGIVLVRTTTKLTLEHNESAGITQHRSAR